MNRSFLLVLSIFMSIPVAHASVDPETAKLTMKMGAEAVANIRFSTESAYLADEDKKQLQQVIGSARREGDIKEVVVASWSDQTFPEDGEILSSTQVDLARARLEAIQTYLERSLSIPNVTGINMAERSALVDRIVDSVDAATQKALSNLKGKTSHSLVLIYGK